MMLCKGSSEVTISKSRMFVPWLINVLLSLLLTSLCDAEEMFKSETANWLRDINTAQMNYGVAVSDVDGDGTMEWIVAGFKGPNRVLKYDPVNRKYIDLTESGSAYSPLKDLQGEAIGVSACDVDGDGREEIYFLNTNNQYSGIKTYTDKLFKWKNGRYVDLFSVSYNADIPHMFAGRSVACVDRRGTGKYSVILATYAEGNEGEFGLIEMDETDSRNNVDNGEIVLKNVAVEAGINLRTGGRGIVVGPILGTDGRSDIFFDNEHGPNALFQNNEDGTFTDIAQIAGVSDPNTHGRGVALADFNNDELVDIVYGNWVGPHRLFLQRDNREHPHFENVATPDFEQRSPIRTVIAADFDNDGNLEVFQNNIVYRPQWMPDLPVNNSLFTVIPYGHSVDIRRVEIGDALEPEGYGTGAAVADLDGDGRLELLVSHGESNTSPLDVYSVRPGRDNHWLRVMPLTAAGAPARGASVTLTLEDNTRLTRIIDGGSGYLCQMEPVAHFGLGDSHPKEVTVRWPDGQSVTKAMRSDSVNNFYKIDYSGLLTLASAPGSDSANPSSHTHGGSDPRDHSPVNSARDLSCRVQTYSNYMIDHMTGCRSRRSVRLRRCAGGCSRGRNCCQALRSRYRTVRFKCSHNETRYSKRVSIGPRRCRCRNCA